MIFLRNRHSYSIRFAFFAKILHRIQYEPRFLKMQKSYSVRKLIWIFAIVLFFYFEEVLQISFVMLNSQTPHHAVKSPVMQD